MELNSEKEAFKKVGDLLGWKELSEKEYDCPVHGKYTGKPVKLSCFEKIIDPPCPKCEEEERARKEAEEEQRILDKQERQRINRLKEMNIGKRLWDETFETFDAYTPELRDHLKICMEFASNPKGRKLVMLGNHGNGKNHLAAAVLKITGGIIHKIFEINMMLHATYSGDSQESKVIDELCNVEMLVIDEIGRTKGGKWELDWLSYVIDKRHENLMPLILISNKHLKEDCPAGGCPDCLQNFVGNDILSRIIEDGIIMEFTGEDYRYKKRAERVGGNNA